MSQPHPPHAPAVSPWILSPSRDLALFVLAPLWIVPLALVLRNGFASKEIQYFVLAFGAMGHNLPGMLRAYGDRALFRRYRTRFILSPILFAGLAIAFAMRGSNAIVLVAFFWAVWHALMQIYGFLRIYDAKVGAFEPKHARLDLLMCLTWFGAALLWSDERLYYVQEMLFGFGIGPLAPGTIQTLRVATLPVLGLVSLAFVWNVFARQRAGLPVNHVKNLLILSSIGFWWWAHALTADVLLGLILFEVFHDVQYLAIVWIFNRRRVDTDPGVGGFTRFVFRRSWGMIGIYIGMVFAYGGLVPLAGRVPGDLTGMFGTIIITSALLHYYFDGFIWKVREESTRKGLGLADGPGIAERAVPRHALKWLFLLAPLTAMWFANDRGAAMGMIPPLEKAQALAASTPNSANAQFQLAIALNGAGRHVESLPALRRSLAIVPGDSEVEMNLLLAELEGGKEALEKGDAARAQELLRAAYEKSPEFVARDCHKRGQELFDEGRYREAITHLRAALILHPDEAFAHLNLALSYREIGNRGLALRHARRGAALLPQDANAKILIRELERQ